MFKKTFFTIFLILTLFSCGFSKKELVFHNSRIEYTKMFEELVSDYSEKHKNISIKIMEERNDAINLLSIRLFNREKIDLFFVPSYNSYYEFINKGYIYGYKKNPKWISKIGDQYINTIKKEGKVYGFPFDAGCYGVVYNKDIFEKNKIGIPKTFENLVNITKYLENQKITPISSAISDGWMLPIIFYSGLKSVINDEEIWLSSMKNKIGTFNIEPSTKIKDFFDYYKQYGGKDFLSSNFSTQIEKFASGENGFAFMNIFNTKTVLLRNEKIKLGFFPMLFDNKNDSDKIYSDVENILAINSMTKYKKEALDFIEYLSSDDAQRIIINKYSVLTPMKFQNVDEPFLNQVYNYIYQDKINRYLHKKIPISVYENTRGVLLKYYNGKKDFSDCLTELDKIWRSVE